MKYYHAAQLIALLDWWHEKQIRSWQIEQEGVKIPLEEWMLSEKKDLVSMLLLATCRRRISENMG